MNFKEEEIEYLKKSTMLNPKDYLKVQLEKRKNPDNYNNLELELRWNEWKKMYYNLWRQDGGYINLDTFAYEALLQRIIEEKNMNR